MAESTTGALISSDFAYSKPRNPEDGNGDAGQSSATPSLVFETPEDLAEHATNVLLEEIAHGGCVDSTSQWLPLLLMASGPEDVSKVRIGPLVDFTVGYLRDIRDILGVSFKIVADGDTLLVSCLGSGLLNVSKSAA